MHHSPSSPVEGDPLFQKLVESPLYQTYKTAFHAATGLDLCLLPLSRYNNGYQEVENQFGNSFCNELAKFTGLNREICACCRWTPESCFRVAPRTYTCLAGLTETAVPVRNGGLDVAVLTTGYVKVGAPDQKTEELVVHRLRTLGIHSGDERALLDLWKQCSVFDPVRYRGVATILTSFAVQLSVHLDRVVLDQSNTEPKVVQQAKEYIRQNLGERIALADVAEHVGVSTFYFCKVFKQSTGMTLTEYINRKRIELTKLKLLNPEARVVEIAFEVGYQSLSQFNRSFRKIVGKSPTEYRRQNRQLWRSNS